MTRILFIAISFLIVTGGDAFSQSKYQPVAVTGFNQDVVANGVTADPALTVDSKPYNGPDAVGWVFVAEDFSYIGYRPGYYLPANRLLKSIGYEGLTYQLADYGQKNSLVLHKKSQVEDGNADVPEGILTFNTPLPADSLFILATSGSGWSQLDISVLFEGGSDVSFDPVYVNDWCASGFDVVVGERFDLGTNTFSVPYNTPGFFTYAYRIKSNKPIKAIRARTSGSGFCNIMAVTVMHRS